MMDEDGAMTTSSLSGCGVGEASPLENRSSYELIYLKAFENGKHLNQEVRQWFNWYNQEGFYQALEYKTPN